MVGSNIVGFQHSTMPAKIQPAPAGNKLTAWQDILGAGSGHVGPGLSCSHLVCCYRLLRHCLTRGLGGPLLRQLPVQVSYLVVQLLQLGLLLLPSSLSSLQLTHKQCLQQCTSTLTRPPQPCCLSEARHMGATALQQLA